MYFPYFKGIAKHHAMINYFKVTNKIKTRNEEEQEGSPLETHKESMDLGLVFPCYNVFIRS